MNTESTSLLMILFGSLTLVLLAYYFLGPILQYLFSLLFEREKRSNVDLDVLIRKKRMLMTAGQSPTEKVNSEKSAEGRSQTVLKYTRAFMENSSQQELKTIITIFDEIQWGDSKFIKENLNFLAKNYKIDQGPSSLSRCLGDLVNKDYFISLHSTELASLQQITKALRLKSLFETIFHQCTLRRGDTIELLAKKYHFSPLTFMLAFELKMLLCHGKSNDQAYTAVMSSTAKENSILPKKTDKLFTKILFKENRSDFHSPEEFTEKVALKAKAIDFIMPIPQVKSKQDLATAYKIFNATEATPKNEIKSRYKKMAINKHPDKLSSFGISKKYEKRAAENFSRLKAAYDIILKNAKDT